jgi:hydroxymethylpyrimidine pyrophosphatase-like HAD family hydrolase
MNPLPTPPLPNAVLSFDFDGTLHDPASDPPVPEEFFEVIRELRTDHHALWGINTGRSLEHLLEGLRESRFPFLPDWVVAREREIHQPHLSGRWLPHLPWNQRCEREIQTLFKRLKGLLEQIRRDIEQHTGAQWLAMEGEPAGLVSRTEEEMEWIVSHITPMVANEPQLAWQRNSIYLRFGHRDFQKGSSLGEIARLHHLPVARCFAIGDSHNDMEMLDASHAGMAACPANAVPEVVAHVTARGGIVTKGIHGEGVVEALRHFFPRK